MNAANKDKMLYLLSGLAQRFPRQSRFVLRGLPRGFFQVLKQAVGTTIAWSVKYPPETPAEKRYLGKRVNLLVQVLQDSSTPGCTTVEINLGVLDVVVAFPFLASDLDSPAFAALDRVIETAELAV